MSIKIRYEQVDDSILWHNSVKGKVITFKATSISQQRTGIHARVSIICEGEVLAWSYMNIEKSEERIRLCNQAYERLKNH